MLGSVGRFAALAVTMAVLAPGCSGPTPTLEEADGSSPAVPRISASLTQDSRDTAATRIAVVVRNDGSADLAPTSIGYADPRLVSALAGARVRTIPAGGQRRFPLPLVDPVCDATASEGRLTIGTETAEVVVVPRDDVGVVARWVQRRCAELDVAAVAALAFTDVQPVRGGAAAVLVLTATPSGAGSGAYVVESVAGTPVFTSAGEPWAPEVMVTGAGEPVEIALPARPARCDGHVFGESAGATAFLVAVRLDGERREVLVRMDPEIAADALDFAIAACRG